MCEELGDFDMMVDYIEDAGSTALCALDGKGCDERSLKYLEKMKGKSKADLQANLDRMQAMEDSAMKKELMDWLKKRKKIIKNLLATYGSDDEL